MSKDDFNNPANVSQFCMVPFKRALLGGCYEKGDGSKTYAATMDLWVRLYPVLAMHADGNLETFASQDLLAREAGMRLEHVGIAIKYMTDNGWLKIRYDGRKEIKKLTSQYPQYGADEFYAIGKQIITGGYWASMSVQTKYWYSILQANAISPARAMYGSDYFDMIEHHKERLLWVMRNRLIALPNGKVTNLQDCSFLPLEEYVPMRFWNCAQIDDVNGNRWKIPETARKWEIPLKKVTQRAMHWLMKRSLVIPFEQDGLQGFMMPRDVKQEVPGYAESLKALRHNRVKYKASAGALRALKAYGKRYPAKTELSEADRGTNAHEENGPAEPNAALPQPEPQGAPEPVKPIPQYSGTSGQPAPPVLSKEELEKADAVRKIGDSVRAERKAVEAAQIAQSKAESSKRPRLKRLTDKVPEVTKEMQEELSRIMALLPPRVAKS